MATRNKTLQHIFLDLYTGKMGSQKILTPGKRLDAKRYVFVFSSYKEKWNDVQLNSDNEYIVKGKNANILRIQKVGKINKSFKLTDVILEKRSQYLSNEVIKKLK